MEVDWDSDEDTVHDINQLNAVLEAEKALPSECLDLSECSAPHSASLSSAPTQTRQRYSKIQQALSANKLVDEKLRRLENILVCRLRQCRNKLKEITETPVLPDKPDRAFKYVNCGKPYFRDRDNFPPPDNEDTILMAKSNMYDFSSIIAVPGWTVKDKSECLSKIHKMSIDIRRKALNSKLAQLQRDYRNSENKRNKKKYEKQIDTVKKDIACVKNKTLNELALPIDQEYDWDLLANRMAFRHSASEFRALWKLFLHPSINKTTWSKTEYMSLQKIAYDNNLQDWERIAQTLNTGRTAYQCFVYFRTNMSNTFTGVKWTREEEEYLRRLIDYYKEDNYIPWSKVASHMENRTKIQIYNKYARLIEQRKGRFLPEEDAVILTCYNKFGKNFSMMAKHLPGRSNAQLRTRFQVLTSRTRTSSVWTVEEDRKLLQCMAQEDTVKDYASLTKHFPGKDRAHIRARYLTLMKWLKRHPHQDVSHAPRRGARTLGHGRATQDLNKAIEELNKRMECEVENHKKFPKITRTSTEEEIEDAIITALMNEEINIEKEKKNCLIYMDNALVTVDTPEEQQPVANVNDLHKVLTLLRSRLDKGRFQNSRARHRYPNLENIDQSQCLLVKSYSKKSQVNVVQVEAASDIWGNNLLKPSGYVLPPNYGTITGCRKLMSFVSQKCPEPSTLNLSVLMKRNILVREQVKLLLDRFNTLFLWPMLLSNENPPEPKQTYIPIVRRTQPVLDNTGNPPPGVAIPVMPWRSTSESDSDKIDLDDSREEDNDNTVINESDAYVSSLLEFEFKNM